MKKNGVSYSFFLIPADSREIRKFHLSSLHIRILTGAALISVFFLVFNVVGFWYYRSLYASFEKDRVSIKAYERERKDLLSKVSVLEQTVGETETLAGKLASMVGTERVPLQKGVGPIPDASFNVAARTVGMTVGIKFEELDPKVDRLETRSMDLQAKIKELTKVQEDKLTYIASTPSIWPVKGWVTSDFGYRRSPFTLASDFHPGLDIAAAWGTPVVSPADGVVTYSGIKNGYGKMVVIDHGFGITTRYGHTSELLVEEGQKIKRGAKIALVGNTGHSTGPHLHYEIHVDGVPVDPMQYILK